MGDEDTPERVKEKAVERMKRLAVYRSLVDEVLTLQEKNEPGYQSMVTVSKVISKADEMIKFVLDPEEANLDAKVMVISSNILKKNAEAFDTSLYSFDSKTCTDSIIAFLKKDAEDNSHRLKWEILTAYAAECFRRTPSYKYMMGTFQVGEVATQRKTRKPREKLEFQAKRQPENIKETEKAEEGIEGTVHHVLKILKAAWKQNNRQAVNFFKLAIDPHSFTSTTENIFHISFLIKDGHADLSWDANKLPYIEPTPAGLPEYRKKTCSTTKQFLVWMDMEKWEILKKAFKITQPMIVSKQKEDK